MTLSVCGVARLSFFDCCSSWRQIFVLVTLAEHERVHNALKSATIVQGNARYVL